MHKRTMDVKVNTHYHVVKKMTNFIIHPSVGYFLKLSFRKWLFTQLFLLKKKHPDCHFKEMQG